MTTTLVLTAHPSDASFTAAWARASVAACQAEGDTVLTSDLERLDFDPVERAAHYPNPPEPFDVLKAQAAGPLPPDVESEVRKVEAADRIILHFPIWWFAPPAILKGWCERVLAHGRTNDVDHRFDTGYFRGRRVLFCASTGSRETESGPDGREGNVEMLLWPLAMVFRYLGFDVCRPALVHGVHGYHEGARLAELEERLRGTLAGQRGLIAALPDRPLIGFNADGDFDAEGRLKPDAPSLTPFIQHP